MPTRKDMATTNMNKEREREKKERKRKKVCKKEEQRTRILSFIYIH